MRGMSPSETKNKCRKNVICFVQFGAFLQLFERYKWNVPYILDLVRGVRDTAAEMLRGANYFTGNPCHFSI